MFALNEIILPCLKKINETEHMKIYSTSIV